MAVRRTAVGDQPTEADGLERRVPRLNSLTSLRFVAALLVFANHIGDAYAREGSALWQVLESGFVGVTFFFVLSGFVLTWTHSPADRPGQFFRRRIARIVPNYFVTWILALGVAIAAGAALSVSGVVGSMSLVQAWHPRPDVHFAVNPVAWTLSVEAFFYLTFPALIGLLARLRRRGLLVVMASCVMATVSWAAVGHFSAPDGRHWVVYVFPLARLPEFVLGMAVGCAMRRGELPRVRLSVAVLTASAAWAIGLTLPSAFQVAALLVVPFAAVVVASTQADLRGPAGGFLRAPRLVRLGAWSYAFYLVHELVIRALTRALGLDRVPDPAKPLVVAGLLVAAVAASAALVAVVERPMHDLLRGGRGGSRRVVSTWLGRLSRSPAATSRSRSR